MPWLGYIVVPASLLLVIAIMQIVASAWFALLRWSASHRNRVFVVGSTVVILGLALGSVRTHESLMQSIASANPDGRIDFENSARYFGIAALYINAWALAGLVLGLRERSLRLNAHLNLSIYQGSWAAQVLSGISVLSLAMGVLCLFVAPLTGVALALTSPVCGWFSYKLSGGRDNPHVLLAYWEESPNLRGNIGDGAPGFSWRARVIAKFSVTLDDARGDVGQAIAVLAMRGGAPDSVAIAYDRVINEPIVENWHALQEIMCANPPLGFH